MRSLSIAATGMLAQQLNVEVISNNIANVNTTSYKRQRAEFQDLLYQNQKRVGSSSSANGTVIPSGVQLGLGVKTAAVYRITSQGNLVSTENPFDLAIQGNGYFQISMPNGDTGYTRAGSFQLGPTGDIVSSEGFKLNPGVTVPTDATSITINSAGEVLAKVDGQVAEQNLGQLELANFANPAGLQSMGGNMLLETPASGKAKTGNPGGTGFGTLLQGFLETSNVNVVQEITNLITAQRAYEMNSKVIRASDEMMSQINQIRA